MKLRDTPKSWRQGFSLYRRRTGADSLGNPTAEYDLTSPDLTASAAEGLDFQAPRSWNSSGRIGTTGNRVEETGEIPGGVLEAYAPLTLEAAEYDRLEVDGALYEVRRVQDWPGHRKLLLQRVR